MSWYVLVSVLLIEINEKSVHVAQYQRRGLCLYIALNKRLSNDACCQGEAILDAKGIGLIGIDFVELAAQAIKKYLVSQN